MTIITNRGNGDHIETVYSSFNVKANDDPHQIFFHNIPRMNVLCTWEGSNPIYTSIKWYATLIVPLTITNQELEYKYLLQREWYLFRYEDLGIFKINWMRAYTVHNP